MVDSFDHLFSGWVVGEVDEGAERLNHVAEGETRWLESD